MAEDPRASQSADLEKSWADYFRSPAVISGLLQFGATAMTPGSGGVGPALSAGAEAAGRALQFQQQTAAGQTSAQLAQEKLNVQKQEAEARGRRESADANRAERKLLIDEQRLGIERDRLGVWEKSLRGKGKGSGNLSTNTLFNGYVKYAQDIAAGLAGDELPEDVKNEIVADPVGWARKRTMETMAGAASGASSSATGTGATTQAGAAGTPTSTSSEQSPRPLSVEEAKSATRTGALSSEPGQRTSLDENPPTFEQKLDEGGYPDPDTLSVEAWQRILSDPALTKEAVGAYGAFKVKAKKYMIESGTGEGGGVAGLSRRAEQFRKEQ